MGSLGAASGDGYDLSRFGLREMIGSSRALRAMGGCSGTMEEAARKVVDFFFDHFGAGAKGEAGFALVRCFKTQRFGDLPPDLREAAAAGLQGAHPEEGMMCLTLLATRGLLPAWDTRHASVGHRAIPLAAGMIERAPMIARMVEQVGLAPGDLRGAGSEQESRTLDVFHVEDAVGSPFVPAQTEFVEAVGVRSVLGMSGMLPNGELFFVLLFSRVAVGVETAGLFRTLALAVKLVLLEHSFGRVFVE